ncbi:hypothetical protein GDO81_024994 [Engystomops pustulosus]|uniref:Uncharacterized protein n=1 Tax=Engystomops pustulosus TaxID=76066 RepID=A0AAV6ZM08_ENGPU|nr:hypothetical protein GDO81_024994 [Engystomops pustulosus]
MVEMKVVLKASSEKRKRTQVFPTPESPMSSSLKSRSYVFFAMGPVSPPGTPLLSLAAAARRSRHTSPQYRAHPPPTTSRSV